MQQPVMVAQRPRREPEYGIMALIFAIITTVLIGFCLCWWSLPFTIVGIILGITVSCGVGRTHVDMLKSGHPV